MKHARIILFTLAAALLIGGCGKSSDPTRVTPDGGDTPTLDQTPPAIPDGLNVESDPVTGKSKMTWAPSSAPDLAGYEIYVYSPDPSRDNAYILVYSTDNQTSSYGLDPVEHPITKYFRLRAVDQSGNRSAMSSTLAAELWPFVNQSGPPDQPPPLPTMDP